MSTKCQRNVKNTMKKLWMTINFKSVNVWYMLRCMSRKTSWTLKTLRNIIVIIIKKDWQCKAGRGRLTPYQSEDPSPTLPTFIGKDEKGKIVKTKKDGATRQTKRRWTCSWNPQSDTIKYGVNQIVPERYWEGNKSPAVLRGSAAGRRISKPMCDQSTACNPDWHIRHR